VGSMRVPMDIQGILERVPGEKCRIARLSCGRASNMTSQNTNLVRNTFAE
jgi:hypothetical protein